MMKLKKIIRIFIECSVVVCLVALPYYIVYTAITSNSAYIESIEKRNNDTRQKIDSINNEIERLKAIENLYK